MFLARSAGTSSHAESGTSIAKDSATSQIAGASGSYFGNDGRAGRLAVVPSGESSFCCFDGMIDVLTSTRSKRENHIDSRWIATRSAERLAWLH